MNRFVLILSLFFISIPSYSYIGPGMSGGILVAVIGFITAIIIGIWGILYYPIKRALKNRKEKKSVSKSFNNDI